MRASFPFFFSCQSPSPLPLLSTMTAKIPKHVILLHRARRLSIMLSCIYMLLVALGATPFAQAQYVLFSDLLSGALFFVVTLTSASGHRLLFMHNFRRPFFPQYDMPEKYDLARKDSCLPL